MQPNYHITEMPDIRKPEPDPMRDTPDFEPEPLENEEESFPTSYYALYQINLE